MGSLPVGHHLTPSAREQALAGHFLATARATAWALGLIYLALALAKSFLYAAPQALLHTLSVVDLMVAGAWLLTGAVIARAGPEDRWVQPLTVVPLVVTIADSIYTMHLLFKPMEVTVFMLAAMVASLTFTSLRAFGLALVLNLFGWALAVQFSHPGPMLTPAVPWVELSITLVAATVFAVLVFLTRRRSLLHIESLRQIEAHQHHELEGAMTTLQTQHEQLQALLRFKTDLVYAVSHDLRIPLTSIKGFTELLVDQFAGPMNAEQETYLIQIEKSALRLDRLLEDMLDLAKLEAGTFEVKRHALDFAEMARDLIESFRPLAQEARVSLSLSLPEGPLLAQIDAERIDRVVSNLLSNALKFTQAPGRVVMRAFADAETLTCEIEDSGVGIAPDELPLLFQRFSQLEQGRLKRGGTGLGLSISKAIIEAHGGRIGVRSVLGHGSVFWFTLPRQ